MPLKTGHKFIVVAAFVAVGAQAKPPSNDPFSASDDSPPSQTPGSKASETKVQLVNFENPSRVRGKFIVVFKSEEKLAAAPRVGEGAAKFSADVMPVDAESTKTLAAAMAERVKGVLGRVFAKNPGFRAFSLHDVSDEDIKLLLADDPRIDFIEAQLPVTEYTNQSLPGDESIWALDRIDQRNLPLNHNYSYSENGAGVFVHLIDSGIVLKHPEFEGRAGDFLRWCPYLDFTLNETPYGDNDECARIDKHRFCSTWIVTTDPYNDVCDANAADYWPDHQDWGGHGTKVAGVIGGKTYGVAKKVTLIPYLSIHRGSAVTYQEAYLLGLEEALNKKVVGSPNVVNVSFGTDCEPHEPCYSPALETSVSSLLNAGMTVIAAAGNGDQDACLNSPARMSKTSALITVGATDQNDGRWWNGAYSGSNYGDCITLFAPGDAISSAYDSVSPDLEYSYSSNGNGTSLSAGFVSGAAALYLSTHSVDSPAQVKSALIASATSGALNTSHPAHGIQTGSPNKLLFTGFSPGSSPTYPNSGDPTKMIKATLDLLRFILSL